MAVPPDSMVRSTSTHHPFDLADSAHHCVGIELGEATLEVVEICLAPRLHAVPARDQIGGGFGLDLDHRVGATTAVTDAALAPKCALCR